MAASLRAFAVLAGLFVCGVDCAPAGAQTPPANAPQADHIEEPENDPPPAAPPARAFAAGPAVASATPPPAPSNPPINAAILPTSEPVSRAAIRPAKPHSTVPIATLPGFEMLPDGGSRLFVEISQSIGVEEKKTQRTLTYVLRGTRVIHRNNENALVTVHFNTPVSRARLLPSGRDLLFSVDLRADASPAWKLARESDGTTTLQIDFAKGSFLPAEALDDTASYSSGAPRNLDAIPAAPAMAEPRAPRGRVRSAARGPRSGLAPANPSAVGD